jgi:RimJ/RimL family protein N-acetyltransferase
MSAVLETERLWLRRMTLDDVDALLQVLGDPIAMVHYPAPFTRTRVEEWVRWNLRKYEEHGYGLWAVVLKESGCCIGDCGLTWQVVDPAAERQLEVGWHIRRDLWNRGLATEAGRACRDYAREVLKQPHLISTIGAENLASQAVARKLGMKVEREDGVKGRNRIIFGMDLDPAG